MQSFLQELVANDQKAALALGVLGIIGAIKVLGASLSFASFLKRHLIRSTYNF